MGTTTDIKTAIFTAVTGLTSVAWPNVPHEGVHPFVAVHVLPAATESVGLSGIDYHKGIIQFDCHIAAGGGELAASDLADTVLALFPRGKRATSGAVTVEINKTGWANTGKQTPDGYFIPVSIPYEVIT